MFDRCSMIGGGSEENWMSIGGELEVWGRNGGLEKNLGRMFRYTFDRSAIDVR